MHPAGDRVHGGPCPEQRGRLHVPPLRCASGASESKSADRYPVSGREEIASADRRHMSRSKILIVLMSQPEREVIYAETGPTSASRRSLYWSSSVDRQSRVVRPLTRTEALLPYQCPRWRLGFAGASRCSIKDPPSGIGEPLVAVRIAKPRALRRTTEFTSGQGHLQPPLPTCTGVTGG